jgi:hypothetical protein
MPRDPAMPGVADWQNRMGLWIGRCVRIKPALIGSHLGWGTIAVPSDEPSFVVASGELDVDLPGLASLSWRGESLKMNRLLSSV